MTTALLWVIFALVLVVLVAFTGSTKKETTITTVSSQKFPENKLWPDGPTTRPI
jgi:hypothetical protein